MKQQKKKKPEKLNKAKICWFEKTNKINFYKYGPRQKSRIQK